MEWDEATGRAVPVPADRVFDRSAPPVSAARVDAADRQAVVHHDFLVDHLAAASRNQRQAPWALPDQALRFDDVQAMRDAVTVSGGWVFDPAVAERYGLRVYGTGAYGALIDDRFFITRTEANGVEAFKTCWAGREPGSDRVLVYAFDDVLPFKELAHGLARDAAAAIPADTSPALDLRRRAQQTQAVAVPAQQLANVRTLPHDRQP